MAEHKTSEPPSYDAEKVRQGEIILRTRRRRVIFLAGLVGFVVLALVIRWTYGTG